MWMSPAIRSILKSSGQSFGTIDLDKDQKPRPKWPAQPLLSYQPESPLTSGNAPA